MSDQLEGRPESGILPVHLVLTQFHVRASNGLGERCFARRASHGQHSASVPIKRSGPPIADGPLTMCFSATASFSASAVLVGLGSLAWQAAPTRRDLPFAAIPLLFAGQQLIEGLLWLSFDSGATGLQGALTAGYAFFSQVFWPVYVPLAVLLLEPSAAHRRGLRLLLAIGAAVSAWLLWQTLRCLAFPPPAARQPALPSLPVERHPMLQTLAADLRYAIRILGRAPAFTLAVVAVLALGIGATTAIFSIVNTVLLRPLPFDDPSRLVRLFHVPPQAAFPGIPRFALSPANFYDWQRQATGFEGMALYRGRSFTLTGTGAPRSIQAATIGAGFFDIVRVRPAQGRLFRPDEDAPGSRVVVISDGFWRTEMGGANVVGRTLTLDSEGYTIIGVMPASATLESWGPMARALWMPLALSAETISGKRSVMPPGWMPVPCRVLAPSAHASRMALQFSGSG